MLYGMKVRYKLFNLFWIRLDPRKICMEYTDCVDPYPQRGISPVDKLTEDLK